MPSRRPSCTGRDLLQDSASLALQPGGVVNPAKATPNNGDAANNPAPPDTTPERVPPVTTPERAPVTLPEPAKPVALPQPAKPVTAPATPEDAPAQPASLTTAMTCTEGQSCTGTHPSVLLAVSQVDQLTRALLQIWNCARHATMASQWHPHYNS